MIISAIVARAKNNVIGRDNDLPWRLSNDLKWFKKNTLNRHIIMGRKSFESLPKPLPNRVNIIVTRDTEYYHSGCIIKHSIDEALQYAHAAGETEAFIIGGGHIYRQTQQLWHRLYVTEVDTIIEDGDTVFPDVDLSQFTLAHDEPHAADEKNQYNYTFRIYERGINDTPTS